MFRIGIPPNGFGIIVNETESEYEVVPIRSLYGPSTKRKLFKWAVSMDQPSKKEVLVSIFSKSITRTTDHKVSTCFIW